ncbi:MAG: hypothetical protein RSD40_00015 [Bacilli bacterium]
MFNSLLFLPFLLNGLTGASAQTLVDVEEPVCRIELHAYTSVGPKEKSAGEPRVAAKGHAYALFKNISSSNITVGYYDLFPNETISVGLWGLVPGYSSSSSSSSSSSILFDRAGVYYNLERFRLGRFESAGNDIGTYRNIKPSQLVKATERMKEQNDWYDLAGYNCSSFAVDMWNYSTGSNLDAGWIDCPEDLRKNILALYNGYNILYGYQGGVSYDYCYYDTKTNLFVKRSV